MIDRKYIAIQAKIEMARRRFYWYCQLRYPSFYRADRKYLMEICDTMQAFLTNDKRLLVINLPPRHGKSFTASHYVEWVLGINPKMQIMTGSYNETLSTRFSKKIRNDIQEIKVDKYTPVYSDVFPKTKIKVGDAAMNIWSLEGTDSSYLATSPTGTATGFGCRLLIIDDIIKNAEESYNSMVKEKHWDWFTNTMLSRLEEGGKIVIIMTRWASDDLAGMILDHYDKSKVEHINLKAIQADGSMLCEDILSKESCEEKKKAMGIDVFEANYQQEPIDLKGVLYTGFKTYDTIPADESGKPLFTSIKNYTDTADTGSDYLCSICYGVYNKEAYILDILYTNQSMETTEPETAEMLYRNEVSIADIESNNGGMGFSRNVHAILLNQYNYNKCKMAPFHQSANKVARILSNSTQVMNHIYYPVNWKDRWPEYYEAMVRYQREGKNKHDDAPDATTGVCEKMNKTGAMSINPRNLRRRGYR